MAAQLTVQITLTDNTRKSVSNIISAVIEKDKYIPFSKLTLRAIVTDSMRTAIADAKRIVFYIGGSLVHSGMIDKAQVIAGSTRDELVLVSMPEQNTESGMDTVPNADENGNPVVNNEVRGDELVAEIKKAVERPAIIDLLRKIR